MFLSTHLSVFGVQLYEIIDTADVYCLVMGMSRCDILTTLCEEGVSNETEARRYSKFKNETKIKTN